MKRSILWIVVILGILVAGGAALYVVKFEGEPPSLIMEPEPSFLARETKVTLTVKDLRSGIRDLKVELLQGGRSLSVLHVEPPAGSREIRRELTMEPREMGLEEGDAVLRVEVRDRSWRPGGNRLVRELPVVVDTRLPAVSVLSRLHYVNQGGTGLVVYGASEDLARSGVQVGDLFFPGVPMEKEGYLALFAIPYYLPPDTPVSLIAEDRAGNRTNTSFHLVIKSRRFRKDTIRVTDRFLKRVMPYFLDRDPSLKGDLLDVFLKVNRDLRKANAERVKALCSNSESRPLWEGPFLRLPNSKTMAGFADHRVYIYHGKEIDRQVHLGVDLASLAMSPVMAANRGKVVFAGELGIYGNTVLLDHGCGLFSMYSHLSRIDVQPGTMLEKGDLLGRTGSTGLAGGDHLHFSMLVRGFFVHPKEWWDPRWVEDHVTARLDLLRTGS